MKKEDALRALRQAREWVASGAETYICFALSRTSLTDRNYDRLRKLTFDALSPYTDFTAWLTANNSGREFTACEIRAHRVSWLDRWIEAIEKSDLP
jgi:hypothetical protein